MRRVDGKLIALGATVLALGVAAVVAVVTGSGPSGAGAADHLDAPGLTNPGGDPRLDITDVYAFRKSGKAVLVMNVNGFTPKGRQATFGSSVPSVAASRRVRYRFQVDNDNDALPEVTLTVTFGRPNSRGVQSMRVTRNGRTLLTGRTSAFGQTVINNATGARAFGGMRDDPFFFNLQGFLDILSTTPGKSLIGCTTGTDKFAGTNVSSIVLALDPALLTRRGSSKIGVWATTSRGSSVVDRMGRPAIATVFIPNNPFEPVGSEPSLKNTYNHTAPSRDRAMFRGEIVDNLRTLFALNDTKGDNPADDAGKISGIADTLLPDILTFDTSSSAGFLNGRKLSNDVIDTELNLITEGAVKTDGVNANDRRFRAGFPYEALPQR